MKIQLTSTPQMICESLYGSGGTPTQFTGTLIDGSMYIAKSAEDCTAETAVPVPAGLYVSEVLRTGQALWAIVGTGSGDLRVLDTGSN